MLTNQDNLFFFEKEHENFIQSDVYKKLKKDFNHLFLDHCYDYLDLYYQRPSNTHRLGLFENSVFYYSIYIYINSFINESHKKIADVGCGYNFLKKHFSNIIGYDNTDFADYRELFNEDFILKHQNEFDSAIAINSLHFISLEDFSSRVNDFGKIVKPGGYGFMTFNLQRMIEKTSEKFLKNHNSIENFYNYINHQSEKIDYKIIAFDNLLLHNIKIINDNRYILYKKLHGVDWPSFDNVNNNSYTGVNEEIITEIENYHILAEKHHSYEKAKDDMFNGNIRLIFQKEAN